MNSASTRSFRADPSSSAAEEQLPRPRGTSGALGQFAAGRAHELADNLYLLAKEGIDQAQRSMTRLSLETVWRSAQPPLRRTATFVLDHPLRSATIVVLLASAALLTRAPTAARN